MADLGDGCAIPRKRNGSIMRDPIEEPTLHWVVVPRANDVSGSEARESNPFTQEPSLGLALAGMTTGRIKGTVLIQRPVVAAGIDTR